MKLIVFSGFLGAGKTVTILSFAKWLLQKSTAGKDTSLVVLENEIGDVAYDKTMLKSRGLTVKNLLSGCICCTLSTDLPVQLGEIKAEYDPDYVIIEPTGAAFVDRIKQAVSYAGVDGRDVSIITVVDTSRMSKLMIVAPYLIENQIRNADILLLSKTDLTADKEVSEAKAIVDEFYNGTIIENTPYGIDDADAFWEKVIGRYGQF